MVSAPTVDAPVRVLVAEDDPVLRALVASTLRADGYTVVEAADGEELLAAVESTGARRRELAAIVSDVCMPGLGGLDVLAVLRCAAWRTPVVLMTAFGEAETYAEARELGASVVLEKPFDLDALRAAIHSVAPRPGLGAEPEARARRPAAGAGVVPRPAKPARQTGRN